MNCPYSDYHNPKTISRKVYYTVYTILVSFSSPFQTICYLIHNIPQNSQRADNPLSTSIRAGTPRNPKSISHRNHIPVPKRAAVSPELLAPLETFLLIIRHPSRFGFTYLVHPSSGHGSRYPVKLFKVSLWSHCLCVCVYEYPISALFINDTWDAVWCFLFTFLFSGVILHDTLFFLFFFIRCHLASALVVLFRVTFTQSQCHTYCHVLASHVSVGHPQIYAFYWIECIMVCIDFMYCK